MPSHYTAPEMFLLTDTRFKQELNTQNINTNQLKNNGSGWGEGIICPTKKKQPMGVKSLYSDTRIVFSSLIAAVLKLLKTVLPMSLYYLPGRGCGCGRTDYLGWGIS